MGRLENVYVKLSGGFSEMGSQTATNPTPVDKLADRISPWFDHALQAFTPKRIMFGGDWPVTNMRGPGDKAWGHWKAVVAELLNRAKISEADKSRVWIGTAVEAYRLKAEV
jgi:predicted TIM-barrel fold metal-dependent hydrolase